MFAPPRPPAPPIPVAPSDPRPLFVRPKFFAKDGFWFRLSEVVAIRDDWVCMKRGRDMQVPQDVADALYKVLTE